MTSFRESLNRMKSNSMNVPYEPIKHPRWLPDWGLSLTEDPMGNA